MHVAPLCVRPDPAEVATPAAAGDTSVPGMQGAVVECLSPAMLLNVLRPTIGLALWTRPPRAVLHRPASALLGSEPFSHVAEGTPDQASRALMLALPAAGRPLGGDIARLGRLFATVAGVGTVRFRLEHVADNACRQHHVDAVRLRLLCTYGGLGTEWTDEAGRARRMSPFHVGVFKGSAYPDAASRIRHRSPPVEQLSRLQRSRLLLCIDEPGVF